MVKYSDYITDSKFLLWLLDESKFTIVIAVS